MSYSINNFFKDVNQDWLNNHKIPSNNTSISYFDLIEKNIDNDLLKIIENEYKKDNSFGKFIQSFYKGRDNDINVLQVFVESMSNFSTYDGLYKSIGLLNLYNLEAPIIIGVELDCKDTKHYTIDIMEPGTGIQKQDYLDKKSEIYKKYKNYLQKFGELIHLPEISTQFLNLESIITKTYPDPQGDIELESMYNPLTFQNLCEQFKHINFKAILDACQIPTHIQKSTIYTVKNIAYIKLIDTFLKTRSLDFWKMWIKSCIYTSLHEFLPAEFRNCYFDFYHRYLNGQSHESNLDNQALSICKDLTFDNLGKLYVETNSTKFKGIKDGATEIIHKVKDVAHKRIMKLTWLSESSRNIACRKLDKMTLKVAYPDSWFDIFKGVNIDKDQFLLNILVLMKNQSIYEFNKLIEQKKDNYWESSCFDVNAYYYTELNEFCIPIGFLFPPFYGEDMSYIQIIAGLGNIVGHEISHGFDKNGRKFDEFGNNYPWWTSMDVELYKIKTQKIVDLFCTDYNGLQVNGVLTLDENLADFGALAICLDVIHTDWIKNPISKKEQKAQLREFFIWYSKTWAYKATQAKQKSAIKTNVHAPAELRVNALLPHFDEFYDAFDFDESYEGFIPKAERIDVWG